MHKPWLRRALIVLALAIPATAYAADKLQASSSCCSCPICPGCDE